MTGWDQLTRVQLLVVVAEQAKVVEQQALQIEALTKQVAELTRLLGQNSGNSSLTPSSDRGKKPVRQQRRRVSGRMPGKQLGAPGSTLEMVADPDEVIEHVPAACTGCGDDLHDAEPARVVVRQVREVPLLKVRVTEHRMHKRACGCGCVSTAPARPGWTVRPAMGRQHS